MLGRLHTDSVASCVVRSFVLRSPLECKVSNDVIEYMRVNKVLYQIGLYDERVRKTSAWLRLRRRSYEHVRAIVELSELVQELGLKVLVVKTIKPFNYVPDDIDVLVIDDDALQVLVKALIERGYFVRKRGTPEITLRRIVGDTYVDLDIHCTMGAGPYTYIDKYYLWRRRTCRRLYGVKVATPNDVDELIITAAHAVLKEFKVILADVFHILAVNQQLVNTARTTARYIGLSKPLEFLVDLVTKTLMNAFTRENGVEITYPFKVPLTTVLDAYIENLKYRMRRQGIKPLKEIVKAPSSKGIKILLEYLWPL